MNINMLRHQTEERLRSLACGGPLAAPDRGLLALVRWGCTVERFPVVVPHVTGALWILGNAVPEVIDQLAADAPGLPAAALPALTALQTALAEGGEETFVTSLLATYAGRRHPPQELLAGIATLATVLRVVLDGWPRQASVE